VALSIGSTDLQRVRGVANYQFGSENGQKMFPDEVVLSHSRKTGRVKHIYLNRTLLATIRPNDGAFALTIAGAERLMRLVDYPRFRVVVNGDVEHFIVKGRNVFARHVVMADRHIIPGEEVVVTNNMGEVLAVGKALLAGSEMLAFNRGVAVKVRGGIGGNIDAGN
jgi:predicted RNA-binding protein (TIGR00451 family)